MNDDLLQQAARALREETATTEQPPALTRARIMNSLHGGKRRRRWHVAVLVPIAAVLAGSTALAGVGNGISWRRVAVAVGLSEPNRVATPVAKVFSRSPLGGPRAGRASEAVSFEALIAETRPLAELEPARVAKLEQASAPRVTPAVNRASTAARSTPRSARATDPELELYRSAHALHFSGADPRAALAAWDAYLARAPGGRFALEARYNRAICLARVGQTSLAQRALEPFASGEHGAYRQESARTLLDALGAGK